ncbi:Methyltransferase domain-containing protein [Actinopolyspora alba]|uniref:Methyltransferase domain-containing protein n=1 Tax=Actinopolyspora alba TaxID=673379 RepID=A0A1I1YT60_9ACTN|nr:Methyltransferase domain-containing protein [Actinopolyspora alba]
MNIHYDPAELFASTAPYYARYRPGYPPEFFSYLADRFALNGAQTVLDLGCGTGQIAIPLAPHVARVIAVDPEPSMLDEGRRLAAEHGADTIDWRHGDSHHLHELTLPTLDLATMGASFHWTDRDALLAELDTLIAAHGAVVVLSGGAPGEHTPAPWEETITDIRTRYLGPARRAGSSTYTHPKESHAEVLARSPFSHVDTVTWTWHLPRDLDAIVGLQFSYSYFAPAQFDDENIRARFEHDLRTELATQFPHGDFTDIIHTEALIATRP